MEDQARVMAERIARRVAAGPAASQSRPDIVSELAAMRASLNELQNRLIQIESKVSSTPAPLTHSPWLAGVNASHPSLERFGVEEATVSELSLSFKRKRLAVSNGRQTCDHCAMCSSRGLRRPRSPSKNKISHQSAKGKLRLRAKVLPCAFAREFLVYEVVALT